MAVMHLVLLVQEQACTVYTTAIWPDFRFCVLITVCMHVDYQHGFPYATALAAVPGLNGRASPDRVDSGPPSP